MDNQKYIGMDVHQAAGGFSISGQTVLSAPGGRCLWCLGILTEDRIAREAEHYGKAGSRPQVVWPNGVLASIGVGLFVQLLCPWHQAPQISACSFDVVRTFRCSPVPGSSPAVQQSSRRRNDFRRRSLIVG